ncbi:hypothetical protein KCU65_g424, partial [Aureobasidium melanogenum]
MNPSARDSQVRMFEDAFVGPLEPHSAPSETPFFKINLARAQRMDGGGQINGVINNQNPARRLESATSVDARLASTKTSYQYLTRKHFMSFKAQTRKYKTQHSLLRHWHQFNEVVVWFVPVALQWFSGSARTCLRDGGRDKEEGAKAGHVGTVELSLCDLPSSPSCPRRTIHHEYSCAPVYPALRLAQRLQPHTPSNRSWHLSNQDFPGHVMLIL